MFDRKLYWCKLYFVELDWLLLWRIIYLLFILYVINFVFVNIVINFLILEGELKLIVYVFYKVKYF